MPIAAMEIYDSSSDKFRQAIQIYEGSFPPEERESTSSFVKALKKKVCGEYNRFHFTIVEKDSKVAAMSVCEYVPEACLGFFSYMAVDKQYRSQGIGHFLYEVMLKNVEMDAFCQNRSELMGCVYEVDRVEDMKSSEDEETRKRRLRFYYSLGSYVVEGVDYYQPSLGMGKPPVRMHLMFHPIHCSELNNDLARYIVESTYYKWYGKKESDSLAISVLRSAEQNEIRFVNGEML